jgi:hypothetical protein
MRDSKLTDLIAKIDFARLPEGKKGVALTVRMKDRNECEAENVIARGNIAANPTARDELLAKFWDNVEFAQKHRQGDAEALLELLEHLEDQDGITEVTRLLVPQSSASTVGTEGESSSDGTDGEQLSGHPRVRVVLGALRDRLGTIRAEAPPPAPSCQAGESGQPLR